MLLQYYTLDKYLNLCLDCIIFSSEFKAKMVVCVRFPFFTVYNFLIETAVVVCVPCVPFVPFLLLLKCLLCSLILVVQTNPLPTYTVNIFVLRSVLMCLTAGVSFDVQLQLN
jgi:hypothetical protein